jgi:hypothetical protein
MSDERNDKRDASALSRRAALVKSTTGLGALACALSGCATSSKKQGEAPKAEAEYQEHPSGLERCGTCKHFIPVTGCEIVAAPVQANGWCKYYKLF